MSEVKVDTISERTAANGVVVDGVTIKDSGLTIPSGGTLTIDSGGTITNSGTATGFGKVLQVVQTHVNTTSSQSLTANTRAQILGLNASITPSSTSSRIRITVRWIGENSVSAENTMFGIQRDSTDIGNPAAAGNRNVGQAGLYISYHANASTTMDSSMYTYIDSPSTTSSITYSATIIDGQNGTLYNQRTVNDSDASSRERGTSNIILEEIAG